MKNIEGWPDTDPYPYRNIDKPLTEAEDCEFVKRAKEFAQTEPIAEGDRYEDIMNSAWKHINYLARKLKQAEEHIKWLNNVGGEKLNLSCGVDIFCRDMIKKQKAKAAIAAGGGK